MDCSLPGSSIHVIFQARVLELGVIAFSACKTSVEKIHALKRGKWRVGDMRRDDLYGFS